VKAVKVWRTKDLPHDAVYQHTLSSGARVYQSYNGTTYKLQPAKLATTNTPRARRVK
jgi:hypothetical protein